MRLVYKEISCCGECPFKEFSEAGSCYGGTDEWICYHDDNEDGYIEDVYGKVSNIDKPGWFPENCPLKEIGMKKEIEITRTYEEIVGDATIKIIDTNGRPNVFINKVGYLSGGVILRTDSLQDLQNVLSALTNCIKELVRDTSDESTGDSE